jgi:hypothetical protein
MLGFLKQVCPVSDRKWDTSYAGATKFVLNKWLFRVRLARDRNHAARPCQTTSRGDRGWGWGRVPLWAAVCRIPEAQLSRRVSKLNVNHNWCGTRPVLAQLFAGATDGPASSKAYRDRTRDRYNAILRRSSDATLMD